jgi:hypothetical protein
MSTERPPGCMLERSSPPSIVSDIVPSGLVAPPLFLQLDPESSL